MHWGGGAPETGPGVALQEMCRLAVGDNNCRAVFVMSGDDAAEATIYVGGMYCSACSWLIETSTCSNSRCPPGVQGAGVMDFLAHV